MRFTEEQEQIRELAMDFARSELRPGVEAWDRDRALGTGVLPQVAELGFFGMMLPETAGGMGFDIGTFLVALEALGWGEPAVALTVAHHAIVLGLVQEHGTDAARSRWIDTLAAGGALACIAYGGADDEEERGGIRASREGDAWSLAGRAEYVSQGRAAGVALVNAATDAGRTLFLVPTDSAGYQAGERHNTMGLGALEIVPVELAGVQVGDDAVVGGVGGAHERMDAALVVGRLAVAAISTGIAQAGLDHALAYAAEREQFGHKLREFDAIRFKLAEMSTRIAAARAMVHGAAAAPDPRGAAEAKLFASESAMRVATEAVQIFGGYGYMRDYPVEKLMRDAKAMELLEGTSDVLRMRIAAELYRD